MIRDENSGEPIATTDFEAGFDWEKRNRIIITTNKRYEYSLPKRYDFDPVTAINHIVKTKTSFESLLETERGYEVSPQRKKRKNAYEDYLQLYFTENINLKSNLEPIVGTPVTWFGNEVASGVGMQKIDILTLVNDSENRQYRIVELKDEPMEIGVLDQIKYYIKWGSQNSGRHLESAHNWNIRPIIVGPPHKPKTWKKITEAIEMFNATEEARPVSYFELSICADDTISFEIVDY